MDPGLTPPWAQRCRPTSGGSGKWVVPWDPGLMPPGFMMSPHFGAQIPQLPINGKRDGGLGVARPTFHHPHPGGVDLPSPTPATRATRICSSRRVRHLRTTSPSLRWVTHCGWPGSSWQSQRAPGADQRTGGVDLTVADPTHPGYPPLNQAGYPASDGGRPPLGPSLQREPGGESALAVWGAMFDPSHPRVYNHGMSDLMDSVLCSGARRTTVIDFC